MLRELTFGPPPNEADKPKSSWYANAAFRSIAKEAPRCWPGLVGFDVQKVTISPSSLVSVSHFIHERLFAPRNDLASLRISRFSLDLDDLRFEFCVVRFEGYASEREMK
jgi:hypothetical protein